MECLENHWVTNYYYAARDQLQRHVYRRSEQAFEEGDRARDGIRSVPDLRKRQAWIRRQFLASIGGLPESDCPLKSRVTGVHRDRGFSIEKVIFQSRPKHYVTANLYLPDGLTGPTGAVQFLCGHSGEGKAYPNYQTVCRALASAGLVVLAQDPIGQGERWSYYEPGLKGTTVPILTREHDFAGAQCLPLGDSLARYFLHDAMRGIDYLLTRPEVDPKRIGVTGNSGGGTQTTMMMLADPRIAAAAPGTFLMNRQSYLYSGQAQDAEQIWPGFTAMGMDHEDILIAMAPRPVCVLAVKYDFFPIEGTRRSVERCRRFWSLLKNPEGLTLVEDASTHGYTRTLATASAKFFARTFLGKSITLDQAVIDPIDPKPLLCTKTGQLRGEFPEAEFVFEANRRRLREIETSKKTLSVKQSRAWLRKAVLGGRDRCPVNPRNYLTVQVAGLQAEYAFWFSQGDVCNAGVLFRHYTQMGKKLPVTVAIWDGGMKAVQSRLDWIRTRCENGQAVLVVDLTAMGSIEPNPLNGAAPHGFYGVIHKLADDLIWLGDSLAAMRVYDLLRVFDVLADWPGVNARDVRFYADGKSALYAQWAKAIDSRVGKVEFGSSVVKNFDWVRVRHYDSNEIYGYIAPGVMRYWK